MPVLGYHVSAADWHGQERARWTMLGKTPAFVDGQIASIACIHGLTRVTANVQPFVAFDGISIVDWTR